MVTTETDPGGGTGVKNPADVVAKLQERATGLLVSLSRVVGDPARCLVGSSHNGLVSVSYDRFHRVETLDLAAEWRSLCSPGELAVAVVEALQSADNSACDPEAFLTLGSLAERVEWSSPPRAATVPTQPAPPSDDHAQVQQLRRSNELLTLWSDYQSASTNVHGLASVTAEREEPKSPFDPVDNVAATLHNGRIESLYINANWAHRVLDTVIEESVRAEINRRLAEREDVPGLAQLLVLRDRVTNLYEEDGGRPSDDDQLKMWKERSQP